MDKDSEKPLPDTTPRYHSLTDCSSRMEFETLGVVPQLLVSGIHVK